MNILILTYDPIYYYNNGGNREKIFLPSTWEEDYSIENAMLSL